MPCECRYCCLLSLNSCNRHRVLSLLILMLFIPCSVCLYVGCATYTFALFSVVVISTFDLSVFELVHMNFYLK